MPKITYSSDISRFAHLWKNGYDFKTFSYIKEGWKLYRSNPVILSAYMFWIMLVLGPIIGFLGLSPLSSVADFIGAYFLTLFSQLLMAGFFVAGHKLIRDEDVGYEDLFGGFGYFKQLALYSLIYFVLSMVCMIPYYLVSGGDGGIVWYSANPILALILLIIENSTSRGELHTLSSLLLLLPSLYIYLTYLFAVPGIVVSHLKAWPAMELSRQILTPKIPHILVLSILLGLAWAMPLLLSLFPFDNNYLAMIVMPVLIIVVSLLGLALIPVFIVTFYAAYDDIAGENILNPFYAKIEEFGSGLKKETE